ncbi:T9SS type A sorting domain-containing protein [Gracilimonas mengyeensis]|uniref:Por secretion system C-terminal sorting domain-containing protein n=1 Tax=Gracilimonas mengyeensis TaxID=1302730 RepID=A0A521DCM0_9BACT|nr:T9SS type A sorting domain-containing protein [Gracilimonas mengyeensis]SMO69322.1 Por secretion system C-terminal sorting domain-containing protein [Gracilimonas mengyeensis]
MGDGFDDMNVIDLEVFKGQLLASGFANVFYRGEFAYYKKAVKAWDGEKWINLHSNLIDSTTIRIDHLVSFNEKLYGYESYYSSKGNESDFGRIFEWDDESKTKKDITIEPDDSTIGLQVGFLSKVNERLIASYSFKKEDGPIENFIAEWSEGQWKQIGKQFRGRIAVVSSYKNSFVAAEIISGRPNHLRIHVFKEGQWSTLGKDDENGLGLNNTVAKVLEFKDQIIVGGKFSGTATQELNHIAQWDGETWSQLGNGLNGSVSDIAIHMGRLVAVQEKEKVFELIDDQWKELSLNIADTDIINKIISYKDTLSAVGRIEGKNGEFNNIIKWNGETWQRQGEIEVGLGSLNTLSKSGGNLITSGDGLVDNGSCIYQWDGEDWQQMSTDFLDYDFNNHGIAPRLTAVFEHQGDIYGAVRIAGFEKIAVLSNGIWRLVNPSSSSDAKHVKGLVSHGGYLMGWGYFESGYPVVENQSSIASWNNGHWQESPTKLYQFSEYSSESSECDNNQCLNSMIVTDNGVYAGGDFSRIGYIKASNFVHIKPEWNAVVVSNEENVSNHIPNDFQLYQNYPNPFNPSTTIKYSIPKAMEVRVNIYNMIGQKVKTVENVFKSAGTHQLSIDGSNMSSGVYLYRVKAGETVKSGRMILLK